MCKKGHEQEGRQVTSTYVEWITPRKGPSSLRGVPQSTRDIYWRYEMMLPAETGTAGNGAGTAGAGHFCLGGTVKKVDPAPK